MAVYESSRDFGAKSGKGLGGKTIRVSSSSSSYSVRKNDSVIVVERTASTAISIRLPAATGSGRAITLKRNVGDMSESLTLEANGAELIDGITAHVFSQAVVGPSITVKDDISGEWIII